jgi:hypothetical protein
MEELDKQNLNLRTRQRADMTWLTMDFGGVLAPLAEVQAQLNSLALPSIESYMAINDEAWGIKEIQRDRTVELSQVEVANDLAIAQAKADTGRLKIAIERAADEYTLAAKIYDVSVKGLIMLARELAGVVEQEALAAEAAKASVDVDKEGIRQAQVAVKIQIEAIEAQQVAADIAKSQVDVAKAHVRAIMAAIEAGKSGVEVLEAQVQVAMTVAESATLQADVAMVFSEAITHQLTSVKVGAEKADIQAGYALINSKLTDTANLYETKGLIAAIRAEADRLVAADADSYGNLRGQGERLRADEAQGTESLAKSENTAMSGAQGFEAAAKEGEAGLRGAVIAAHAAATVLKDSGQTAAQALINAAHIKTFTKTKSEEFKRTHETEYISG